MSITDRVNDAIDIHILDGPLTLFPYIYIYIKLELVASTLFSGKLFHGTPRSSSTSPSLSSFSRIINYRGSFYRVHRNFWRDGKEEGIGEAFRQPLFRCNNPGCFQISSANDVRLERVGTLRPISRSPRAPRSIPRYTNSSQRFTMERELASAEPFSCLVHAGTHHGTEASGGGSGAREGRESDQAGWTETDEERLSRRRERDGRRVGAREAARPGKRRNRAVERAREKESYPDTHPRGSTRTRWRAHGRRTRTDAAVARKKSGDGDREGGWSECQERTRRGTGGERHERARRRTVRAWKGERGRESERERARGGREGWQREGRTRSESRERA